MTTTNEYQNPRATLTDSLVLADGDMRRAIAQMADPQTQFVSIPKRTIKGTADLGLWLDEAQQRVVDALELGPVNVV